jgi:hypothetical protein
MPKAVRFSASPATNVSSEKNNSKQSNGDMFVSVALFSGIGLLASLLAILSGLFLGWY